MLGSDAPVRDSLRVIIPQVMINATGLHSYLGYKGAAFIRAYSLLKIMEMARMATGPALLKRWGVGESKMMLSPALSR